MFKLKFLDESKRREDPVDLYYLILINIKKLSSKVVWLGRFFI